TCLTVLTCVFAALLAAWGIDFGSLDMGWGTVTAVGGVLRVCFSFTLGVIIHRLNMRKLNSLPRIDVQVLLVLTMLCLLTPFGKLGVCYELVVVMLVFPLIVAAACFVEPSRSLAPLFHELGRVSYSVYILHTPLILGVFGVWKYVAEADPTLTPTTSCPILLKCYVIHAR